MPRFHHVNLPITPDNVKAEENFLLNILGYRRIEVDDRLRALGANWFEDDRGCQVHISPTPHVAIDYGEQLPEIEERLRQAGIQFKTGQGGDLRVVTFADPAGNEWELRGFPR
ncbi:MAG: glyoxalase [Rhodospirillaceae bacterium]|nr:MAG: glyoxalase [Rhodospirillaceae bacterium]